VKRALLLSLSGKQCWPRPRVQGEKARHQARNGPYEPTQATATSECSPSWW